LAIRSSLLSFQFRLEQLVYSSLSTSLHIGLRRYQLMSL